MLRFLLPCLFLLSFVSDQQRTIPELEIPSKGKNDLVIRHKGYTLCFNTKHRQANWVAYELTREKVEVSCERSSKFYPDPELAGHCATDNDYKASGYDRGHLAPARDMGWSKEVMKESFYYSNMSPQLPGFNRGIWKRLEEQVRDWAVENEKIEVVTGPVLSGCSKYIGDHVSVPRYYYKVILDYTLPGYKAIGFIIPNQSSGSPLQHFGISIDSVEKITGIDFFPLLDDEIEEDLEKRVSPDVWNWN